MRGSSLSLRVNQIPSDYSCWLDESAWQDPRGRFTQRMNRTGGTSEFQGCADVHLFSTMVSEMGWGARSGTLGSRQMLISVRSRYRSGGAGVKMRGDQFGLFPILSVPRGTSDLRTRCLLVKRVLSNCLCGLHMCGTVWSHGQSWPRTSLLKVGPNYSAQINPGLGMQHPKLRVGGSVLPTTTEHSPWGLQKPPR
jgi:hypothetical protein